MQRSRSKLAFSFARFAEGFDDHIRKSIRGYGDLLDDCIAMSEYFVEDGTSVFDIGCSTGRFLLQVWEKNRERAPSAKYVGIDIEPNFAAFWEKLEGDDIDLQVADIRSFQMPERCSFVTSLFSLQFVAERDRQEIVDRIHRKLIPGGAFILAEKTLSICAKLQDILTFVHYDYKRRNFTDEEILDKERSLRALLKPWPEDRVMESLLTAGFQADHVQPFWRNHNFVAFIALR